MVGSWRAWLVMEGGKMQEEILQKIQVHMPFRLLAAKHLDLVVKKRLNPEISFNYLDLETTSRQDFVRVAKRLTEEDLTVTFHAPFMDLRPGAIDPEIRRVSLDRLKAVIALAEYFHPRSIVCHPSFDEKYYLSSKETWFENSVATWSNLALLASQLDTILCLENVYEAEPDIMAQLLKALQNPHIRFCFDTGHFNVFSRATLENWLEQLAPYLYQLHIHDNSGRADEHAPIAAGTFPFTDLFSLLRARNLSPLITLESHSAKDLWQSVDAISAMNLLDQQAGIYGKEKAQ